MLFSFVTLSASGSDKQANGISSQSYLDEKKAVAENNENSLPLNLLLDRDYWRKSETIAPSGQKLPKAQVQEIRQVLSDEYIRRSNIYLKAEKSLSKRVTAQELHDALRQLVVYEFIEEGAAPQVEATSFSKRSLLMVEFFHDRVGASPYTIWGTAGALENDQGIVIAEKPRSKWLEWVSSAFDNVKKRF